jgi:hypothetical protein
MGQALGQRVAQPDLCADRNLALCFVSNFQSEGMGIGVRTEAIVDAAFAAL